MGLAESWLSLRNNAAVSATRNEKLLSRLTVAAGCPTCENENKRREEKWLREEAIEAFSDYQRRERMYALFWLIKWLRNWRRRRRSCLSYHPERKRPSIPSEENIEGEENMLQRREAFLQPQYSLLSATYLYFNEEASIYLICNKPKCRGNSVSVKWPRLGGGRSETCAEEAANAEEEGGKLCLQASEENRNLSGWRSYQQGEST